MKEEIKVPKRFQQFFHWFCKKELIDELDGDLAEIFHQIREEEGIRAANMFYRLEVLKMIRPSVVKKLSFHFLNTHPIMLKNYIKIALRNIHKQMGYSLLKIMGLTLGLATVFLIFLYLQTERSFDRFHDKGENIYRVINDLQTPDKIFNFAVTPPVLAANLKNDFPEVKETTRIFQMNRIFENGNIKYEETELLAVDSTFSDIFSFAVLDGNLKEALSLPFSMAITQEAARKYFGDQNPIGQYLTTDGIGQPFEIKAILDEVPFNSHIQFDLLISFSTLDEINPPQGHRWFFLSYYTYILLDKNADPNVLESKFPDFIERNLGDIQRNAQQSYTFYLQALQDIHLSPQLDVDFGASGNRPFLRIFSIIAIFILLLACVNYINLSTARSSRRAGEIGIRKVVGARTRQVATQFLVESIIITFIAFVLALALSYFLLPFFNSISGMQHNFGWFFQFPNLIYLSLAVLVVGILAGAYPALIISKFRPITTLKGNFQFSKQGNILRNSLTVFQLLCSIILIGSTIVIFQQFKHLKNQDLGYNKEAMVVMDFRFDRIVQRKHQAIKDKFSQNPAVKSVSVGLTPPNINPPNWYAMYENNTGEMQNSSMYGYIVDYDFFDTYEIEFLAGRKFDQNFLTDSSEAYIVNEAAVKFCGWGNPEDALGKQFNQIGKSGKIIGVIRDFNFESLHSEIEPLAIQLYSPRNLSSFSLRIQNDNIQETIANLEKDWNELIPHRPFEFVFLDESLNAKYQSESRMSQLFSYFTILAVLISCLGLLGLTSFMMERHRKSISIRKVFGASPQQIVIYFSSYFSKLVVIAFLIGIPIGYFAMNSWLVQFPYRIDLSVWVFTMSGGIALIFTLLATLSHTIKAAHTNPIKNLRSE